MSEMFCCGDAGALVSYLYDDVGPEERDVIAAHLAGCASCAREVATLGATRRQLAAWTVPDAGLGFRVARAGADPGAFPWWRQPMPAWMQAAAAVALFASGLVLGAGRGANQDATAGSSSALSAPVAALTVSPRELSQLEERLRAEMTQIRTASSAAVVTPVRGEREDEAVLRRVQTLLAESEERQRRELALRTAQMLRDVEVQRRSDLAQVQRTMGEMEGLTGAEIRQQRETLNYLINVSQRR